MPLATPLPETRRITDGRVTLDLPDKQAIRTQTLIQKEDQMMISHLASGKYLSPWTASIQLNEDAIITWTGDRNGANLMGWAILTAAHALKADYRLSPEEPGEIYFYSATAAALVFDLALTAPWLNH